MRHLAWGLTQSPQKIAVKIITTETVCVSWGMLWFFISEKGFFESFECLTLLPGFWLQHMKRLNDFFLALSGR